MSQPPNFGQAFDLSSLGRPKTAPSAHMPGLEVTTENLTTDFLPSSKEKPVIIIAWSSRSPESQEMVTTLAS
ncbi:MAG: co-chaperone YbbN, partial [Actinobacteria bacterium]|nr:co-chaperone YbbN [Actinomycetota bacterium]